jgi:predicted O-methyltransferase YrrM
MDPRLAELLRELDSASQAGSGMPRLARETGQLLNLLARLRGARAILEVGTSNGYTTLWLGDAAAATEGTVTTVEVDVWKVELARVTLARSPHADRITLLQGDALELLPVLEGPFDFVVLDANKRQALGYLRTLMEKLPTGAVVCCEEALAGAATLADYLTFVHDCPGFDSLLIPIGEGVEVTYKAP